MVWHKVWIFPSGEAERVEEEESKDDDDATQDAPPQLLVHHCFNALLPLQQVLRCEIEGVQSPDVESGQRSCQRKNNEQDEGSCVVWCDCQAGHGVYDSKNEVAESEYSNIPHCLAETRLHDTVAHTDNKEEEEGKGVSSGVQDSDYYHQDLCTDIISMVVRVI